MDTEKFQRFRIMRLDSITGLNTKCGMNEM